MKLGEEHYEQLLAIQNATTRYAQRYAETILANDRLVEAEAAVLDAGGTEYHLAGARKLIDTTRGA